MKDDPVISRIRSVRKEISARFGHDIGRLGAHYIKFQSKYKDRMVGAKISAGAHA